MYRFETQVRYSEMGEDRVVYPHQIVDYFQDCSVLDSEEIGKGLDYSREHKRGWILSAWQIEISEYPVYRQHISVGTWAYSFSSMYGYRNFDICDENNRQMVKANSLWCMVDMEREMPVKVTQEDVDGYVLYPGLDMPEVSRKLKLYKEGERQDSFSVRRNDIDTNGHVNNARYIDMAEEYLPKGFLPDKLKVQYRQAAKYGDRLYPFVTELSEGYAVSLRDEEDHPYVNMEFLKG